MTEKIENFQTIKLEPGTLNKLKGIGTFEINSDDSNHDRQNWFYMKADHPGYSRPESKEYKQTTLNNSVDIYLLSDKGDKIRLNELKTKVPGFKEIYLCFNHSKKKIKLLNGTQQNQNIKISIVNNEDAFVFCINNKPLILLLNESSDISKQSTDHKNIIIFEKTHLVGIGKFKNITNLSLINIKNIKNLKYYSSFKNLKSLNIYGCPNLEYIDDLQNMKNLTNLSIEECSDNKNLKGLNELVGLKTLKLDHCSNIQNIKALINLKKLEKLEIFNYKFTTREAVIKFQKAVKYFVALKNNNEKLLAEYKDITTIEGIVSELVNRLID